MKAKLRTFAMLSVVAATAMSSVACSGAYMLGYRASYGNDLMPPTGSRGTTTSIRYRDYGGVLSKALLLILSAPQAPQGTTSSETLSSSTSCGGGYCTTYTQTEVTYTPPSAAEMAAYGERVKDWSENVAPAILSGAFRAEAVVDVASTKLGGDTSGFMMALNFRIPTGKALGFAGSNLSIGLAGGKYTMHGRNWQYVADDGSGVLTNANVSGPLSAPYYGFPVKFTGLLTKRLALYAQTDMNLQPMLAKTIDAAPGPQTFRLGSQWMGPFFYIGGEVSIDRMRASSLTATAEVGLAF